MLAGLLVFTALTIAPCIPSATWCVNSTRIVLEARRLETRFVLTLRQRTRDAADIAPAFGTIFGRQVVLGHHVTDPDATPGSQDAPDLGEHGGFVDREVDDAVRDHDIDRVSGSGICSITPLRKWAFVTPASRAFCCASASISSVMSTP